MTGHRSRVTARATLTTLTTRTALTALLAALATLLAVALPGAASAAERRWIADRVHDTRAPSDITRVTVSTTSAVVVVTVRHRNLRFDAKAPVALRIAYDTGRRFSGPEFFLRVVYQSDVGSDLRTARGWGRLDGPATSCTGERVTVSDTRDLTRVRVPASCLGSPSRVRVHVRLRPAERDGSVDVAPRSRTMGPWVSV